VSSTATRTQSDPARIAVEVQLRGLSRRYGSVVALDNLDLTVQAGELIALLGPSGCGKTTTLRLLAGLEDADTGRITVGGRDITRLPASKRDMGMVFQAYSLFPHMTVRQNVAFGLRLRRISSAHRDRRALEMLQLVGLETQADRYPHQISGGQQQRVALARALAAVRLGAGLVLLDEPTAQLDVRGEAEIFERILAATRSCTTILISHRFSTVRHVDRIAVVENGAVAELGSHDELMARRGRYWTMFTLQAQRFATGTPEEGEEELTFDVLA